VNKDKDKQMRFFRVERKYQEIILDWFKADHVKEYYYGDGLQSTLNNLELYCQGINNNGRYSFDHWISYLEDEPFGFLMTSSLEGSGNPDNSKWYIEGKHTFTLDLLIGPKVFLGRGLAARMIQEFILDKFSHADYFIIDPAKSNPKAIHVYEKAGFKTVDEFCPLFNPIPHLMMRMAVKDLKDQANL
jgi:RimJ/RimL family protein N-acetyltransferase